METQEASTGKEAGAHSGVGEGVSELGEVLATAKRRCPAAVDGEEGHHIVLGSSELA